MIRLLSRVARIGLAHTHRQTVALHMHRRLPCHQPFADRPTKPVCKVHKLGGSIHCLLPHCRRLGRCYQRQRSCVGRVRSIQSSSGATFSLSNLYKVTTRVRGERRLRSLGAALREHQAYRTRNLPRCTRSEPSLTLSAAQHCGQHGCTLVERSTAARPTHEVVDRANSLVDGVRVLRRRGCRSEHKAHHVVAQFGLPCCLLGEGRFAGGCAAVVCSGGARGGGPWV